MKNLENVYYCLLKKNLNFNKNKSFFILKEPAGKKRMIATMIKTKYIFFNISLFCLRHISFFILSQILIDVFIRKCFKCNSYSYRCGKGDYYISFVD